MSRYRSLRLAEFWRMRLTPLLSEPNLGSPFYVARVFEAVGWLIEGVFCGYFDRREADLVWARFRPTAAACENPEITMVTDSVRAQVSSLIESADPFPEAKQMTLGRQMMFELPLFSQALLLADRLDSDELTNSCIELVYSAGDEAWRLRRSDWLSIVPADVVEELTRPFENDRGNSSLLAGYLLLLEHMEASKSFFQYARERSTGGSDFDSYCERIGGLNAWRVPLVDFRGGHERFAQLRELLEVATRNAFKEELPSAKWSDFEAPLDEHLKTLNESWETHHLAGFLVTTR